MAELTNIEIVESNFIDKYSNNHGPIPDKYFIASELSKEPLVNYLARTSGSNKEQPLNNYTLSSIFRGTFSEMEYVSKDFNSWKIYGEIYYYDVAADTICLPLVLSTNRILDIKSKGLENEHIIHLSVIKWLAQGTRFSNSKLAIIAVDRLFTNYKKMPTSMFNFISVDEYIDSETIEKMLTDRLSLLDKALKTKKEPSICSNFRWHKKNGKSINMSCNFYCGYNHVCKHAYTTKYVRVNKDSLIY